MANQQAVLFYVPAGVTFCLFLRVNIVKISARFARKATLIVRGKSMCLLIFRAKREENFGILRISKVKFESFAREARRKF